MVQFVKHFFPNHQAPGAEFVFDANICTHTYYKGMLEVIAAEMTQNRHYTASQRMTALGLMRASVTGGASSLDGLTKQYLTPEGTINLSTLAESLKAQSGMQTAVWSAHVGAIQKWQWGDNQVSLLMNMFRFVMLRRMTDEVGSNLDGSLGTYDDGHVRIDMNQFFNSQYPATNNWEWPGGVAEANYPVFSRLETYVPTVECDAVDLRTMTNAEAEFTLLMTGAWRRRSRFRLDYQAPKLCENLYYRFDTELTGLNNALAPIDPANQVPLPVLPGWEVAWSALRKYVTQNRLFGQFSTALYMMSCMTYQFMPATAEACWWLSVDWVASLPKFNAIRGRYTILNEGEAALVSHRALAEWGYINNRIEKVNLIGLVMAQAVHTGFAVRAARKGIEIEPADVYNSEADFYAAHNMISAAAAEATRISVPLSGMSNVYLYASVRFDDFDESRKVVTLLTSDEESPDGYEWTDDYANVPTLVADEPIGKIVITGKSKSSGATKTATVSGGRGRGRGAGYTAPTVSSISKALTGTSKSGVGSGTSTPPGSPGGGNGPTAGTEAPAASPEPKAQYVVITENQSRQQIKVSWVPFAGAPVLIMPLNPFKVNTPLNLGGIIDKKDGVSERRGWRLEWYKAWEFANLARLAGYDIITRNDGGYAGPDAYFAPNDVNMTWPLLRDPDNQADEALITGQVQRPNLFIMLPQMNTKFYMSTIKYKTHIFERGTALGVNNGNMPIAEYGGSFTIMTISEMTINVPEGVSRLRGYISRQTEGFRFAGNVQAGLIPQDPATTDATPAAS